MGLWCSALAHERAEPARGHAFAGQRGQAEELSSWAAHSEVGSCYVAAAFCMYVTCEDVFKYVMFSANIPWDFLLACILFACAGLCHYFVVIWTGRRALHAQAQVGGASRKGQQRESL